jgi:FG-GAP repeat/FG-GAP-like repeat
LDGGSFNPASGTTAWKLRLPTGTSTWVNGTVHTIDVRALDSAGNVSPVQSLSVRKGVTQDINGDGYPDIVLGAVAYGSSEGRAYVFLSSGSNGITTTQASAADAIFTGEAAGDLFGTVAIADIDGNGYADVVVGATGYQSNTGRVYVFLTPASGSVASKSAASADTIITGEAAGDQLGEALAIADFNRDGFDDVVASAIQQTSKSSGKVYIFQSAGTSGITVTSAASATDIIVGEAAKNSFGVSVATGDINGDSYPDLIVGAYTAGTSNTGRTYIFISPGSSGITETLASSATTTIAGEGNWDLFGVSVATGDLDGNGYDDVVVGAYSYDSTHTAQEYGRVYEFLSQGSNGITVTAATSATTIITGEAKDTGFGQWVATADIYGNGLADIIVGASGGSHPTSYTGRVYVLQSTAGTGVTITAAGSADSILTGESVGDTFGFPEAVDLVGSGRADVIAGSIGYNSGQGRGYIFMSAAGSGIPTETASSADLIIAGEASSAFGEGIALLSKHARRSQLVAGRKPHISARSHLARAAARSHRRDMGS